MLPERYLQLADLWSLLENRQTPGREETLHVKILTSIFFNVILSHIKCFQKAVESISTLSDWEIYELQALWCSHQHCLLTQLCWLYNKSNNFYNNVPLLPGIPVCLRTGSFVAAVFVK